jgi:hypothetical protein
MAQDCTRLLGLDAAAPIMILEDDVRFQAALPPATVHRIQTAHETLPVQWRTLALAHWPVQMAYASHGVLRSRAVSVQAMLVNPSTWAPYLHTSATRDDFSADAMDVHVGTMGTSHLYNDQAYAIYPAPAGERPECRSTQQTWWLFDLLRHAGGGARPVFNRLMQWGALYGASLLAFLVVAIIGIWMTVKP